MIFDKVEESHKLLNLVPLVWSSVGGEKSEVTEANSVTLNNIKSILQWCCCRFFANAAVVASLLVKQDKFLVIKLGSMKKQEVHAIIDYCSPYF